MKLTPDVITDFETDQGAYGTEVALSNLLWRVGADLLSDLGVTRVRTSYTKRPHPVRVS